MIFSFRADHRCKVKTLLKHHDISKGLLAKIKFQGGNIWVNDQEQNATYLLDIGDKVTVKIPDEKDINYQLKPVYRELAIVYEDDHFLVLDKPAGVASIPSSNHSNTMANFVKGYYYEQNYPNKQIHIVTRLDRDTSGLMLLAKHGYAHARMDKQLKNRAIDKRYYALVSGTAPIEEEGDIIAPIARDSSSIITRCVDQSGKYAHTSYRIDQDFGEVKLVAIKLHTGRTHQIRVHFSHQGYPLLGDDLYGGAMTFGIERQALHCYRLSFYNPFLEKEQVFESKLTDDFENVIMGLQAD